MSPWSLFEVFLIELETGNGVVFNPLPEYL